VFCGIIRPREEYAWDFSTCLYYTFGRHYACFPFNKENLDSLLATAAYIIETGHLT